MWAPFPALMLVLFFLQNGKKNTREMLLSPGPHSEKKKAHRVSLENTGGCKVQKEQSSYFYTFSYEFFYIFKSFLS